VSNTTPRLIYIDQMLFDRELSDAALNLWAQIVGWPGRDPGSYRIQERMALKKNVKLAAAWRELEERRYGRVIRQHRRPNRLVPAAAVDPKQLRGQKVRVDVPASTGRIFQKTRGSHARLRLFAVLSREQMIRGSVHIPNDVLAWMVGRDTKTIECQREWLRSAELLAKSGTDGGLPIETIPGDHTLYPAEQSKLNPDSTRRIHQIQIPGFSGQVYARATELADLEALSEAADEDGRGTIRRALIEEKKNGVTPLGAIWVRLDRAMGPSRPAVGYAHEDLEEDGDLPARSTPSLRSGVLLSSASALEEGNPRVIDGSHGRAGQLRGSEGKAVSGEAASLVSGNTGRSGRRDRSQLGRPSRGLFAHLGVASGPRATEAR